MLGFEKAKTYSERTGVSRGSTSYIIYQSTSRRVSAVRLIFCEGLSSKPHVKLSIMCLMSPFSSSGKAFRDMSCRSSRGRLEKAAGIACDEEVAVVSVRGEA